MATNVSHTFAAGSAPFYCLCCTVLVGPQGKRGMRGKEERSSKIQPPHTYTHTHTPLTKSISKPALFAAPTMFLPLLPFLKSYRWVRAVKLTEDLCVTTQQVNRVRVAPRPTLKICHALLIQLRPRCSGNDIAGKSQATRPSRACCSAARHCDLPPTLRPVSSTVGHPISTATPPVVYFNTRDIQRCHGFRWHQLVQEKGPSRCIAGWHRTLTAQRTGEGFSADRRVF
jgi:hypothetical protein